MARTILQRLCSNIKVDSVHNPTLARFKGCKHARARVPATAVTGRPRMIRDAATCVRVYGVSPRKRPHVPSDIIRTDGDIRRGGKIAFRSTSVLRFRSGLAIQQRITNKGIQDTDLSCAGEKREPHSSYCSRVYAATGNGELEFLTTNVDPW